MKAISLWEPWATLMKLGLKHYETRSWPIPTNLLNQRIAIHAAQKRSKEIDEIMLTEPFKTALKNVQLNHGKILCTLEFIKCYKTEFIIHNSLPLNEVFYGNYGINRYAWESTNLIPLITPIPFKGKQGWFNVPDDLISKENLIMNGSYYDG